jgi:hypothetical protein
MSWLAYSTTGLITVVKLFMAEANRPNYDNLQYHIINYSHKIFYCLDLKSRVHKLTVAILITVLSSFMSRQAYSTTKVITVV